jgi:hypothetical protein
MKPTTLASLQGALAEIYDLPATPDVAEFLMTDRQRLGAMPEARASDEQLIIVQEGDTLSLALFIDASVLERLARCDPYSALNGENLADYLTVAEGVSHFVYLAWNAGHDKPVTLLELELQAEIDKYVLAVWLLREQGAGRFPHELHRVLFERARVDPVAAGARAGMYRTASTYAGRFCQRIAARFENRARSASREMLAELRRFYRLGNARKLAFIERHA